MSEYDAWIGREVRCVDRLDEALAARWRATFNLDALPRPNMPQGIHFCLCAPETPTAELGADGHPARDDTPDSFFPPFPMPRRMWASSSIEFCASIAIGADITRTSRITAISEKEGGSGKLAFVNVEHETHANAALAVIEKQTLVYRESAAPGAPLSPAPPGEGTFNASEWDVVRTIAPDTRLLFRYSALTFNTHRIHFDAPYAREVERYRGLVVHGPLIASLLLQLAASKLGDNTLQSFEFRGMSPAIAGEPLHLVMRRRDGGYELAAFADDGRQVTNARGSLAT